MSDFDNVFQNLKKASRKLGQTSVQQIQNTFNDLTLLAQKAIPEILHANQQDLANMDPEDPKYDRLLLN